MPKVFVYGTLRKGFMFEEALKGCRCLGEAKTVRNYGLYFKQYPIVTPFERKVQIVGEVYGVNDATVRKLDQIEGHPNFYRRYTTEVILRDGTILDAFIYFQEVTEKDILSRGGVEIPSGDFKVFMSAETRVRKGIQKFQVERGIENA